jgi:hypothetical protein
MEFAGLSNDEIKEQCGACSTEPNKCFKRSAELDGNEDWTTSPELDSICICNPFAEDWPVHELGEEELEASHQDGPLKCEDWCTAPCGLCFVDYGNQFVAHPSPDCTSEYTEHYRVDCGTCDEDYACNPQAKDWDKAAKRNERTETDEEVEAEAETQMCETWCNDDCDTL